MVRDRSHPEREQALEQASEEGAVVSLQAEPPTEPALLARQVRRTPPDRDLVRQEHHWSEERHYFRRRLSEELSRCGRDGAPLSIVLVQAQPLYEGRGWFLSRVEDAVRRGLREYDILCHTMAGEYRLILPGADARACAQVAERLRRRIIASLAHGPALQVVVGTASWPEQGPGPDDLVQEASVVLVEERQRQRRQALGDAPAEVETIPTTVCFEGFPQQVKVEAVATSQGLRLRLPLRFLRRGASIQLESGVGMLAGAALGRGVVPTLYVDIVSPEE